MHISGHIALLYIFSIYSIFYLLKSKTKNEFLINFTFFMFFIERNSWKNAITSLTTSPIRTQPTDIALIILLIFSLQKFLFLKKKFFFNSFIFSLFTLFIIFSTIIGILRFGYAGIAEFRSIFFFLIIMLFIAINVNKNEIIYLIKCISNYLMPLILLAPINLLLVENFLINNANRQFGALMYESIVLGFVGGLFYYRFIDLKYKLPIYLLPIFSLMIPYTAHRTTWGAIIFMFPFILYWFNIKKSIVGLAIFAAIPSSFLNIDASFLQERLTAFTSFETDGTGSWRLLIWNAVIENASFWGRGLGARFVVYADKIGFGAMHGAHNGFILILYYLGYSGVALLFLLFIFFLYSTWKNAAKKNNEIEEIAIHRIGFLATVSLIAYMIGYGFDLVGVIFVAFSLKYAKHISIKNL